MSDISCDPDLPYYPMDRSDWRHLHTARDLAGANSGAAAIIGVVLDRIQERARTRFAMVVWGEDDVLNAAARAMGDETLDPGDRVSFAQSRLSRPDVEEIIGRCATLMADLMIQRGWDVQEETVGDYLREQALEQSCPTPEPASPLTDEPSLGGDDIESIYHPVESRALYRVVLENSDLFRAFVLAPSRAAASLFGDRVAGGELDELWARFDGYDGTSSCIDADVVDPTDGFTADFVVTADGYPADML